MSMGRIMVLAIVLPALVAGAAIYYLQVYAFYRELPPQGPGDVMLTAIATGAPEPLPHEGFRAIDADSSPIRYRACFVTPKSLEALSARYVPYDGAVPREAPAWFGCFDADEIGAALEEGRARAFLGQADIRYGIDRVVAVLPDGRGFVWHQINHCGEVVFDGRPAPEGCPRPPAAE